MWYIIYIYYHYIIWYIYIHRLHTYKSCKCVNLTSTLKSCKCKTGPRCLTFYAAWYSRGFFWFQEVIFKSWCRKSDLCIRHKNVADLVYQSWCVNISSTTLKLALPLHCVLWYAWNPRLSFGRRKRPNFCHWVTILSLCSTQTPLDKRKEYGREVSMHTSHR